MLPIIRILINFSRIQEGIKSFGMLKICNLDGKFYFTCDFPLRLETQHPQTVLRQKLKMVASVASCLKCLQYVAKRLINILQHCKGFCCTFLPCLHVQCVKERLHMGHFCSHWKHCISLWCCRDYENKTLQV